MNAEHETVTVGAVNWKGTWGDKAANLAKMKSKVREAAQLGINIVCFPELALSGYECGEEARGDQCPCAMHAELAETIPGPSTEEIAALTSDLGMYVIFGMPERDAQDTNVRYISAAIVGPEGILGSYRKLQLATPPIWSEFYCFRPGSELPLFETRYGPIGIQICADFWVYPELTRLLALRGARIVFVPVGSGAAPGKVEMMTCGAAAAGFRNFAYIVTANHVGTERTMSYYGHSTIAGPHPPRFCTVFSQGGDAEEIVYATLNFEPLALARKNSRVKEAGNWKLISRGYQELADSVAGASL
ncbi:MAG: carbon-nitrogen hydrolase family protein [Chloroflexi bacterium]|nr:carbon-nitrogen hydrolase family protein [Chloroflexota bacterium]